jgi:N-acetylmuramoyl-L-alanine amidase
VARTASLKALSRLLKSIKSRTEDRDEYRYMRDIDKIIIHCTATPDGRHITVKDIRGWHLARGFKEIGYHYVIYLDGSVHGGRALSKVGAHVKGHNTGSIGIAYVGGIDRSGAAKDTLNPAQEVAIVNLIKALRERFGELTLHGHNEFENKACPSFNVKTKFQWLL